MKQGTTVLVVLLLVLGAYAVLDAALFQIGLVGALVVLVGAKARRKFRGRSSA